MKQKFYHATPARFKKGDRISACSSSVVGKNYQCSLHGIYLTTSPYVHFTVIDKAVESKWNVYEVSPIGKLYRGMWDEWITMEVEVVQKIGEVSEMGKGLAKFSSSTERTRNGYRTVLRKQETKKKDIDLGEGATAGGTV